MEKHDVVMGSHTPYIKIGILNCKVGASLSKTMKESKRPYKESTLVTTTGKTVAFPTCMCLGKTEIGYLSPIAKPWN